MKVNAVAAGVIGAAIGAVVVGLLHRPPIGGYPSQTEALSACNRWADPQFMVYVDHWKEWVPIRSCQIDASSKQILAIQPSGLQPGQTTNWPDLQRGRETPIVVERFRY